MSIPQESLWELLCEVIPKPEQSEVSRIIGSSIVDTNKGLWEEVVCLNGILAEMSMLDVEQSPISSYLVAPPVPPRKGTHSGIDTSPPRANRESDNNRRVGSFDPYEFIATVKDNLSVSRIHISVSAIRTAFMSEKCDLEHEILSLTRIMDGEVDLISKARSPPMSPLTKKCTLCSVVLDGLVDSACAEALCSKCRRLKKLHSRLPKNLDRSLLTNVLADVPRDDDLRCSEESTTSNSIDCSVRCVAVSDDMEIKSSGGNTKFRSRIKAAMDDHHFIDDFR